jgi:hypothetical protein
MENEPHQLETLLAISLGTHALLIKLISEMKSEGLISGALVKAALTRAYALLEEDADPIGIKARVMLESLEDDLAR